MTFLYHLTFGAPDSLGGPRRNIAVPFGMEKLEWSGYPTVKNFDDIFSCFEKIPACDEETDGRTDRHLATAQPCYAYVSRGKNW